MSEVTNGSQPLLSLEGVNTYYGQMHILQDANLRVGAGELVCLLGGNASGKSTTLKTVLGIVRPRTGTVRFDGEDVTGRPTSYRIGKGMRPRRSRAPRPPRRAGSSSACGWRSLRSGVSP